MQFAIPHAPRRVRFTQVPGAVARLVRTILLGLLFMSAVGAGAAAAGKFFIKERAFLARAEEVEGLVARTRLPPMEQRVDAEATMEVLYNMNGMQHTVSGVRTSAEYAEGLGRGARVKLLVDPAQPDQPREARFGLEQAGAVNLLPWGLGAGGAGGRGPVRARAAPHHPRGAGATAPGRAGVAHAGWAPAGDAPRGGLPRHLLPAGCEAPVRARARPGRGSRAQRREGARRRGAPRARTGSVSSTRIWPARSAGFVDPGQGRAENLRVPGARDTPL